MDREILRRIAERGLSYAQLKEDSAYCDIFQHMLDEMEYDDSEVIRAFRKLAEKVQDPKFKDKDPVKVWATIATEIAEELEMESML